MKFIAGLVLALLGAASAGSAQDRHDTLRAALAVLPSAVFAPAEFDMARYLDLSLLAGLHGGKLDREAFLRGRTGAGLRPFDALVLAGPERWSEISGVDITRMRFVAGFGQPPQEVAIWGMADATAAGAAFEGLKQRGFAPAGLLPGVIANGEPGRIDMAARDPENPWSGMLGKTSVVALRGAALLQAADAAAFAPVLGGTAMAESGPGAVLLAALEAQEGAVLQAHFSGPYPGFGGGIDLSALMGRTPEEAQAILEEQMDQPAAGVPFYSGMVIADVMEDEGPVLLIALAYGDCAVAGPAAERAAGLWPQSLGGKAEGEAEPLHVDAGEAGCAAVLRIPGGEGNVQYDRAIGALMQRDLAPIRISME